MKRFLIITAITVMVFVVATIGGSLYMLDYSLAPDPERRDTAKCFLELREKYPEMMPWLDSLNRCHALRDTFVSMPSGECHHAYYVRRDSSQRAAIIVHGWRDSGIKFFYIARLYHQLLGCNVLIPDLHAHGLSEGEAITMGWHDRHDVLHWLSVAAKLFKADDFCVHGVSMGAATTMNVSGEKMPEAIRNIRFVEDCGYTSVWDEFRYQLNEEFSLPPFPLLYTTSLLCKLRDGWSFGEAAPIEQVSKCPHPMLFIHGDKDDFVPSHMVRPLYEAKKNRKSLWFAKGSGHALSYYDHREEYARKVCDFFKQTEKK